MKLPRDLSGRELVKALCVFGCEVTRQLGSQRRLTTTLEGEHHLTIPDHDPLRVGTLAAILGEGVAHHRLDRDQVVERLFG